MNEIEVKKELAEVLVGTCLNYLVHLGKVKSEDVNHKWYVEFNETKLNRQDLGGAATLGQNNRVVVYLLPNLTIDQLIYVIAHEVVHLVQICKGELIPMYGYKIWRGQEYKTLRSDNNNYFEIQPWEKEADELHPILLEHLKSKMQDADK